MEFLDFEIRVSCQEDEEYLVEVIRSPAGESTPQPFFLPLNGIALENCILNLQNALLRTSGRRRRAVSEEVIFIEDFGRMMFEALLPGDIRSRYHESRNEAFHRGVGLRVKLRIEPPELSALPWEFLYDDRDAGFVSMSRNTPIVRYLNLSTPIRPLNVASPLRILAMAASPSDQETLDVAVERERLTRSLRQLEEKGLVKLDWLEGQTWRDLQTALYQNQYHIFHFVGHGYYDETKEEGMVIFSNRSGLSRHFSASDLARLLADQMTLRLCVLNNCEGAKAGVYDTFSSTAATLVQRGVPVVIAMQYDVTDEAAIELAESFYAAVAEGLPVDAALSETRKGISFALPGSLEWGTPVLFMRADDGHIFNFDATMRSTLDSVPAAPPEAFSAEPGQNSPDLIGAVPLSRTADSGVKADVTLGTEPPVEDQTGLGKIGILLYVVVVLAISLVGLSTIQFWPLNADRETLLALAVAVIAEPLDEVPPSATPLPADPPTASQISLLPTVTKTPLPSPTPTSTSTQRPTATDSPLPSPTPTGASTRMPTATKTPLPSPTPTGVSTRMLTATATSTRTPTATIDSKPTRTPVVTPRSTSRAIGTVQEIGGIPFVYVPAGEFEMGYEYGESDERPMHIVHLDGYWIMQTEVTNAQYGTCVDAGKCSLPNNHTWNDPTYAQHPVTHVSWMDAQAFAEWFDSQTAQEIRLPTEAEWEKAARGTTDRIYPWGNDGPTSDLVNFAWTVGATAPVGSYGHSASPYGTLDMAGNAEEWVADWYNADYYTLSHDENPQGPARGSMRVARGGAWLSSAEHVRAADRSWYYPDSRTFPLGVRLASSGY